ncbi:InlB B-repeat-containing protein [Butyrivibrio sp. NC2002]|uniref:InlB B-repeat-containing protein n=1 Tax=Butyrivibrio sp. NC2002 TaxID=1410610 RepID=UPI00055D977E|nr:InlB B-repeat-containing protein [Butyrivibrio sp. NC2002]
MRKSIARKLAGLLAIVVMTTTFASDYNSIGARASEENAIEAETLETATDAEASEESEVVEDSQEVTEEAEKVVEEVSETTEDSEETAEAEEQTEEAAEPAEDAEETSTEGSEEVASEETPAEETPVEETPAEETPAEDAAAEETAEDVSVVNITYTAGVGGTVSIESEQVTDAAAGATATADDGYKFVNWTNEDEVIVSEDATFTPSGDQLVDGAVYYANFMKAEKEFRCEKEIDGIKITLSADKGVLPADVELNIVKVENEVEEQITELLDEKTGDDVEVAKTYSYDITFKAESAKTEENPEGIVQPEDEKTVEIKFSQIEEAASADTELAVYHVEDDISDADIVAEADSKTATDVVVDAEHFSIYSVVLYEDHLIHKDHKYPVNISVVDELGNDITEGKEVTIYLDRGYKNHYYISTADAAKEMVNFVDNQIFTFVRATCNGKEFDRFNKADGDNKVKLYNGNTKVADLDDVKDSGITFEYAHVTLDHLDFGFMDPEEYNYYKNNKAVITAQISNGKPIQMYSTGQDADINSYEYRADLYNYGADQYAIATETIKFTIQIGDQVFEKTTTKKDNAEAAERCYTNHNWRQQGAYGFDYVFSFADDFKLKGDVVYHKNDGTEVKWADTVNFGWNTTKEDYSVLSIDTIANKESAPEQFNVYADHVFKGWRTKDASGKINLVYEYNNGEFSPAYCKVTKGTTLDLYAVWEENTTSYTIVTKYETPENKYKVTTETVSGVVAGSEVDADTIDKNIDGTKYELNSNESTSGKVIVAKDGTTKIIKVYDLKCADYKVEYYYQDSLGNYPEQPDSNVVRSGKIGTTAQVTDDDKKSTKEGYTYDESKTNDSQKTIKLDEKTTLKVYFKKDVTGKRAFFYVLIPTENTNVPKDSSPQSTARFTPGEGGEYHSCQGVGVDYTTEDFKKRAGYDGKNIYDITGVNVKNCIVDMPEDTKNKITGNIQKLYGNNYSVDNVVWYTYKNANDGAGWHFDGYVQGVDVDVTYYLNSKTDKETKVSSKEKTGEYTIKDNSFNNPGYTFVNWNTKPDGTGETYNANDVFSLRSNLVLYAKWKPVDYKTIYLDEDKKELGKKEDQHYGDTTYTLDTDPTKEGYEFTGWVKKDDVNNTKYLTADIKKTKVTGDVTYIATYKQVIFKAYYKVEYYYQTKEGTIPKNTNEASKLRTAYVNTSINDGKTLVEIEAADKTRTKKDVFKLLDEGEGNLWSGFVTKDNTKKNPLILKVYYVRDDLAGITITITSNTNEKIYDGTDLTDAGFTYTATGKDADGKDVDLKDRFEVEVVNSGKIQGKGSTSNTVKSFVIKDKEKNQVYAYQSAKYKKQTDNVYVFRKKESSLIENTGFFVNYIIVKEGTLTVTPRKVTITVPGVEKFYDGTAYSASDYDKSKVTITAEYTAEEIATHKNNMNLSLRLGKNAITVNNNVVTVADSRGTDEIKLNTGKKVRGSKNGWEIQLNGKDIKKKHYDNYDLTIVNGDLVIKPVTATITIPSAEKVYNGKAFSNEEYSAFLTANNTNESYTNLPGGLSFKDGKVKVSLADYTDVIYNQEYDVADWNRDAVTLDTDNTVIVNKNNDPVDYEVVYSDDQDKDTSNANIVLIVSKGSLRILRRNVTLTSKTLTKEFELGVPLTADERVKAGETDAKEITANAYKDYTVDGFVKGDGFVEGEGLNTEKTKFTGERIDIGGTDEKENTFEYVLKDNTKATNYKITSEYGDLVVTKRDPEHKYKIKIALSAQTDEAGRDTTVYYSGVEQKANMKVDVTIDTHQITDAITDSDVFAGLSGAVKNALNAAVGSIKAHAEEGFVLPDGAVLIPEHNETINDKMSVRISQLYLTGGAGTDAGDYPIFLHESNMKIELLYDGKTFDLSDEFEIEIEKDGQKVTTDDAATLAADAEDETVVEDKTDIIGYLHVLKKDVVLTSASATKVYDGTPLTAPTVTASENTEKTGFATGEGAAYNVTGTITEPGTVSNTFTYALQENTLAANYNISTEEGTLTVTKQTEENPPEEDDKKNDKKDDKKDKKEKKESTNSAPFDDSSYDDSSNDSANSAPANNGEVLGVNREADGQGEEAAVLGARRAGTEDSTNSARVIVILIAAGAVASILAVSRKKKEDKNN